MVRGDFASTRSVAETKLLPKIPVFFMTRKENRPSEVMRQSTELLSVYIYRELVEELHPLMKEALERRPEVMNAKALTDKCVYNLGFLFSRRWKCMCTFMM